MIKRLFALSFVFVLALAHGNVAVFAQEATAQGTWSAVQASAPGDKLVVDMKSGERIEGRFRSASDAALVLAQKGADTKLERGDIKRVFRHRGTSRLKGAVTGAVIGGAAGTASGAWVYSKGDIVGSIVPGFGVLGAGIGAGIGALVGRGQKKILLYEVR